MQTLEFNKILGVYIPALANSAEIDAFCKSKYGKSLIIMDGFNGKNPPKKEKCPYMAFTGCVKHEGDKIDEFLYHISWMCCIYNEKITKEDNVEKYDGAEECRALNQLIYNALCEASANYPITEASTTVDAFTHVPQFPGYSEATIKIPVCIGGEINF